MDALILKPNSTFGANKAYVSKFSLPLSWTGSQYKHSTVSSLERVSMRMETMTPYKPRTSAKMRMRTMPTYRRGCCELARTTRLKSR